MKAIAGAALLAGAITLDVVTAGAAAGATTFEFEAMLALYAGGVGMLGGALADALTANRGMNITTRQPASPRQIIYGTQRVGGVLIYEDTEGSSNDQYVAIHVLATHEIDSIEAVYLDGRRVYFQGSGSGWQVRNGLGFGGIGDSNDHTGPDGKVYNFGGTGHSGLYFDCRYGDQVSGDIMSGIAANSPAWAASANGNPWVGGCAYVGVKLEYNTNVFPSGKPEFRYTVRGKHVYDPRTGTTGYSTNPALIINDILLDAEYGLGYAPLNVNQAQLIAAANICDEMVALAGGGFEPRYACSYHYDTATPPGNAVAEILKTMGGRMSHVGQEWFIYPAAWTGPSLSFNADHLTGPVEWSETRELRSLSNRVIGNFTAPNYPYNPVGNAYNADGYDRDGNAQDNFGLAFQTTAFPQFACDVAHGYAADQYLIADGGFAFPMKLDLPAVLSVSQAQRLAKIALLRNRAQGTGKMTMNLEALQLQCNDTFSMSFAQPNWVNKVIELNSFKFKLDSKTGAAPNITITLGVNEANPEMYEWDPAQGDEQTILARPAATTITSYLPVPPGNVTVVSNPAAQPDGTIVNQLLVSWTTPQDRQVQRIQVQYKLASSSVWLDGGNASVLSNAIPIPNVISTQTYNVQVCSVRSNGGASVWVGANNNAPVLALPAISPTITQANVAQSALSVSGTTVHVAATTATLGSVVYPVAATTVSGLTAGQVNYVYTVDPNYTGGSAATPVVTTNRADFLGKVGYVLLGQVSA